MGRRTDFSLMDKYLQEEGQIYLSGIQALVRLPMDQHRADRRAGLRTATFITGYRGSPLGGLDLTLERLPDLLKDYHIHFVSGVNEDLAATAVFGSQMVGLFPGAKYDGVLGIWYGKAPGVDRSGDAFKHANFAGIGKNGGVLAMAGDDPPCKSSTLPNYSEVAFFDANFPILYPGNVQELLDLGLHGFALSRYCGLWTAFKVVTNVADESGTVEVGAERVQPILPSFEVDGTAVLPSAQPYSARSPQSGDGAQHLLPSARSRTPVCRRQSRESNYCPHAQRLVWHRHCRQNLL